MRGYTGTCTYAIDPRIKELSSHMAPHRGPYSPFRACTYRRLFRPIHLALASIHTWLGFGGGFGFADRARHCTLNILAIFGNVFTLLDPLEIHVHGIYGALGDLGELDRS